MMRLILFCVLIYSTLVSYVLTKDIGITYNRSQKWNIESHIVGGQLADDGEYPSMASIMAISSNSHGCGGTIISETYIATAAHCMDSATPGGDLIVRVGTNKWNETGSDHQIVSITIHPGWDPLAFNSADISLVEVSPPIEFNEVTQPAKLPAQDQETIAGSDAIIVGWGMIDNEDFEYYVDLREGFVNVRDHQECYGIYETEVQLTDAQICADVPEGGVGTCGGDSGGPLYVDGEFIGIASWISRGCGFQGWPGVFTRIASYRDWITSLTGV